MWNPNLIEDFKSANRSTTDKVDWGLAAQQWLKNKEMYESWQQQMQMMPVSQTSNSLDQFTTADSSVPPANQFIALVEDKNEINHCNTDKIQNQWMNYEAYNWQEYNLSTQTNSTFIPTQPNKESKISNPPLKVPSLKLVPKLMDIRTPENTNGSKQIDNKNSDILKSNKQLPNWIRDGLANRILEKEKQKKVEKACKNDTTVLENNEFQNYESINVDDFNNKQMNVFIIENKDEELLELSDEEKQEIKTKLIKSLVTEILLDTTNYQMKIIAHEVFKKASGKFKPIAKTNALYMITNGLEDNSESENESDDEEIEKLRTRGEEKRKDYELKCKDNLFESNDGDMTLGAAEEHSNMQIVTVFSNQQSAPIYKTELGDKKSRSLNDSPCDHNDRSRSKGKNLNYRREQTTARRYYTSRSSSRSKKKYCRRSKTKSKSHSPLIDKKQKTHSTSTLLHKKKHSKRKSHSKSRSPSPSKHKYKRSKSKKKSRSKSR